MAKKKKNTPAAPAPMPVVTPDDLAAAKALIEGLGLDIPYSGAKRLLERELHWERSLANAVVVALHEEGFLAGSRNYFYNPRTPALPGVVRGAREADLFTVMAQSDPEIECPVPGNLSCLPGDTFMLRKSIHGWRVADFVARHQSKWVCKAVMRRNRDWITVMPINSFAPVAMSMLTEGVPETLDFSTAAFEVELLPESMHADPYCEFTVRFVREVGNRFDPLGEIAIAAAEYDLPVEFSGAALEEAAALPDHADAKSMARRVDLRDIPFVTIDGEDARDFDDAVFCTKIDGTHWRLLVAIADVSHYVKPGSPLDVDAQRRATSVYFPASVVPMLPEKLSNGLCSLNPDVDRLTLVCDAVLNDKGETQAYQFYPAVIHSHARLTYTAVWEALSGNENARAALGERMSDVETLYGLFKMLREARSQRHALDFETKETQAVFDESGTISAFRVREHNDAHRLIEECMLVANVCAADFVIQKKRDTLFRVHAEPSTERINTLRTVLKGFGEGLKNTTPEAFADLIERTKENEFLQTAILRSMSRACYTPENIGHYGLQYGAYAHFTSPIRRYPDLLLHRTIKGILSRRVYVPQVVFDDSAVMVSRQARGLGSRPEEPQAQNRTKSEARKSAWSRLGIICSAAERRADDATRDVMNYLKCDYMMKHGDGRHEAVVTGMIPAGIFVALRDIAVEGFVHISKLGWGYYDFDEKNLTMTSYDEMTEVRIGDRVVVALEDVDIEARRMSFVLISNKERRTIRRSGKRSRMNRDD